MGNDMKKINFVFLVLLLSGCGTTQTGPLLVGKETYVVSRQAGAFPSGREPLLQESIAEANQQCNAEKKKLALISSTENPGPYILGNYPKATVTFKCE
jgi:hypothetical protein